MDRETRHQIKHDKFVDEVSDFYDDVRKNSQKVIIGLVGVLVIIGIGFAVVTLGARQERQAQGRLAEAMKILGEQAGEAPAAPGAEAPKYKTEAEKIAAAEPILNEILDSHSRTDAAQVASLYLAQIELGRGETDKALSRFESFARKNKSHILAGAAQMSVYELKLEKSAEAVIPELESELATTKSVVPQESIMMLLGKAYEKAGNKEKSQEMYRRVATEFPQSPYASEAQQKTSST
jgi:tetratricopeptide (TPR) repeat protein